MLFNNESPKMHHQSEGLLKFAPFVDKFTQQMPSNKKIKSIYPVKSIKAFYNSGTKWNN